MHLELNGNQVYALENDLPSAEKILTLTVKTGSEELLSEKEIAELSNMEKTIASAFRYFYEMGKAMKAIREQRLYRSKYKTFDEYCADRWEMSRRNADRLIEASEVTDNLRPIGLVLPNNEAQVRPLAQLKSAEQQQEAWQKAVSTAPDGKVTAAHIAYVVEEIKRNNLEPKAKAKIQQKSQESLSLEEVTLETNLKVVTQDLTPDKEASFNEPRITNNKPDDAPSSKPNTIVVEIALVIKHLSPTQLAEAIGTAANDGLSKAQLEAIIKAAKQALHNRCHS